MRKLGLLILADTPNQAEPLTALVRALGYAVEQTWCADPGQFVEELDPGRHQLALAVLGAGHTGIKLPAHEGIPAIALIDDSRSHTAGALIEAGFDDAAYSGDKSHIKHLIRRNLKFISAEEARARAEARISAANTQLTTLLENLPQAVALLHQGVHVYANSRYLALAGVASLDAIDALPLLDFIGTGEEAGEAADLLRNVEHGRSRSASAVLHFGPAATEVQASLSANHYDGEPVVQMILSPLVNDQTAQVSPLSQLQIADPDTHIYSRQHMTRLLDSTVAHVRETGAEYLAYLIHLETGPDDDDYTNRCMQIASEKLVETIGENDVLGRYGANSFLLLSLRDPHLPPARLAENLRRSIGDLDGMLPGFTRSRVAGLLISKDSNDGEHVTSRLKDIFIEAQENDEAVRVDCDPSVTDNNSGLNGSPLMSQAWARRVSSILKDNRLTLTSLPVISLRDDDRDRYALRLQLSDEDGKDVSIDAFRQSVAQSGLAGSVDRWIIFNAARQLVERLRHNPGAQFFIPLVSNVVHEEELFPWIGRIIEQFKLPPNSLMLETPVDAALEFPDAFARYCKSLNELNSGVYLTGMDDPTITHELYNEGKNRIRYMAVSPELLHDFPDDAGAQETIEILVAQCHREKTALVIPDVIDPDVLSGLWKLGVDMIISTDLSDKADDRLELDLTATLGA
ncbi:EAL domain-containing protein [Granulosicoccaceae sp. 1_MG-2023]|nr:EAL domain-containing protein [Granulosicoccaceae sp. 1_MG-2023]